MKIGIVGYGTVGKTLKEAFNLRGHDVFINEIGPGVWRSKRYLMENCDIIFVCTQTDKVNDAVKELNKHAPSKAVIVIKSTVLPGTTERLAKQYPDLHLAVNPEFLRHYQALEDFLNPDRIVIGSNAPYVVETLCSLYREWNSSIFVCDPTTAEAIKHFSNALLSVKVAYANEVKNICAKLGINAKTVMEGVCADQRFNPNHLDPFKGLIGGPCLSKDLLALVEACEKIGCATPLLKAAKEYVKT